MDIDIIEKKIRDLEAAIKIGERSKVEIPEINIFMLRALKKVWIDRQMIDVTRRARINRRVRPTKP